MSSSENKRTLVWLGVAIVFFLSVLWWKRDRLFGGDTPKPDPNQKSIGGVANGGTEATPQDRFKPIRNTDPSAPQIAVNVVDDVTGKPLAGARVVLFTHQAKILADEQTDATGSVVTRPMSKMVYAEAAWYENYEIRAQISKGRPVEIRLTPARFVNISVGDVGPAQREWHKTSNAGLTFKFARTFNPRAAKHDYFEFKMYEHIGLRDHEWPVVSNPVRIPRYLPGINAKLRFHSAPSLENHLDKHGMRDQMPPSLAAEESDTKPIDAPAHVETFDVVAPPRSPNALIAHYTRSPAQDGVLLLNVSHLDRDETSPSFGTLIGATLNPSTYEEHDGKVTFKVYELPDTIVYLKLLHFPKGKPREIIKCNPVSVHGLTETTLADHKPASMTIELTGKRAAGEAASVSILDDRFEPALGLSKTIPANQTGRWTKLEPTTHWIVAQDSRFASGLHEVTLKPGGDRRVAIEMKPGCRVTLIVDDRTPPDAILIHDKTTGSTQTFLYPFWQRFFTMKRTEDGKRRLTSLRYTLYMAQGAYEFGIKRGDAVHKTVSVLDAATKLIRLE